MHIRLRFSQRVNCYDNECDVGGRVPSGHVHCRKCIIYRRPGLRSVIIAARICGISRRSAHYNDELFE